MWANWYDVASDLSAFHRVDNPVELDPQRLIDLASRIPAYTGVVAARARFEEQQVEINGTELGSNQLAADPVFSEFMDVTVVEEVGLDG